jgi:hypothetical protein
MFPYSAYLSAPPNQPHSVVHLSRETAGKKSRIPVLADPFPPHSPSHPFVKASCETTQVRPHFAERDSGCLECYGPAVEEFAVGNSLGPQIPASLGTPQARGLQKLGRPRETSPETRLSSWGGHLYGLPTTESILDCREQSRSGRQRSHPARSRSSTRRRPRDYDDASSMVHSRRSADAGRLRHHEARTSGAGGAALPRDPGADDPSARLTTGSSMARSWRDGLRRIPTTRGRPPT